MVQKKLRVFYLDGVPGQASARYRVYNALEQLRLAGREGVLLPQDFDPQRCFGGHRDTPGVLVIHRAGWDERIEALVEAARQRNLKVLFDIDDLVFDPLIIPWVRALARLADWELEAYEDGVHRYLRMLRAADGVLTSTLALARIAALEGVPAFVHRNALDARSIDTALGLLRARTAEVDEGIALYFGAGTATHDVDFAQCGPAVEKILRRYPAVSLLVQGDVELGEGLRAFGSRVRRLPWQPWPDYFAGIAQAQVNLAPLEVGNPYCEVKSELKYFEAAALSVPTVASATAGFREAIRPGENGFLASSEDEWYAALEELIRDPERRRALGQRAQEEVLARYHPAVMAPQLVDLLTRIAEAPDLGALSQQMGEQAVPPWQPQPQPDGASGREAAPAPSALAGGRRSEPERPRLRIGWLMPTPLRGGGGARNILRLARHLQAFGHEVTLYVDPVERFRSAEKMASFIQTHFPGDPLPVVLGLEDAGPSDALIATFWLTAYALKRNDNCRAKFYLVQDFEPYFYPMGDDYLRAEATYKMGFFHITSGPWCTKVLRERYGAQADYFDFPLDSSIYYPRPRQDGESPRVLFFARPEMPRRCYNLGIEALSLLHLRLPYVRITLFGSDEVNQRALPFPCENLKNLDDLNRLAALYSSADAALVLSTTNTSLVPFEVLSCGCPVVDLDLEVNQVNYRGSDSVYLLPPDPEAIADGLCRLLEDDEFRERYRQAGFHLVANLPNEEQAARRVEQLIFRGLGLETGPEEQPEMVSPMGPAVLGGITGMGGRPGILDGLMVETVCRQEDGVVGELLPGVEVSQTFSCAADGLAAVAVKVAKYGQEPSCTLEFRLSEASPRSQELVRMRQSMQSVVDNGWSVFRFAPLRDSAGKTYRFTLLSPDASSGNAVTVYQSPCAGLRDGQLHLNGRSRKGALVFQAYVLRPREAQLRQVLRPEQASQFEGRRWQEPSPWLMPAQPRAWGEGLSPGTGRELGGLALELARLRRELQGSLRRLERRQEDLARRLAEVHNFLTAVRRSFPYRALRKIVRALRLVGQ